MILLRSFACLFFIQYSLYATSTFSEVCIIWSQFLKNPLQVGEVAPLSKAAGKELSKFLKPSSQEGLSILEVGGGCGAVSVTIAQQLRPQDHLDVIEISQEMCAILRKRLHKYTNVTVHCCSILDWPVTPQYDYIVSTLPFNSLGRLFTQDVIALFKQLIKPGGIVSYVEYPLVKQVLQYFYGKDRKARFREVQGYLACVRADYLLENNTIFFNVPPVNVYHLKFI